MTVGLFGKKNDESVYGRLSRQKPEDSVKYRNVYENQQIERSKIAKPQTMTSRLVLIAVCCVLLMVGMWISLSIVEWFGANVFGMIPSGFSVDAPPGVTDTVQDGGLSDGDQSDGSVSGDEQGSGSVSGSGPGGVDGSVDGSVSGGLDGTGQSGSQVSTGTGTYTWEEIASMPYTEYRDAHYTFARHSGGILSDKYTNNATGELVWEDVIRQEWRDVTGGGWGTYLAYHPAGESNGNTSGTGPSGSVDGSVSGGLGVGSDGSGTSGSGSDLPDDGASDGTSGVAGDEAGSGGLSVPGGTVEIPTVNVYNNKARLSLGWCMRHVTMFKLLLTLLSGLILYGIMYPIMKKNLAAQNVLSDTSDINQWPNDAHIQTPDELQRAYDWFPDVGAHAPIQVSSLISHMALTNKGLKSVQMPRRADKDIKKGDETVYLKGEVLLDSDGEPIVDKKPMIDEKFMDSLWDASELPKVSSIRRKFNPTAIPYNPDDANRDKLKGAETVADMINKYWELPDYEPQRPGGAYIVDTQPVNTMVLAITRAGKGQTIIE